MKIVYLDHPTNGTMPRQAYFIKNWQVKKVNIEALATVVWS